MVVGSFQCNCRLLVCPETGDAALVDPGDDPQQILKVLGSVKTPKGSPIQVKYLLHTHGHLDHIGGTRRVRESLSEKKSEAKSEAKAVPQPIIALHRNDEPLYLQLKMQGNLFGMNYDDPLPVDHYLEDGEELSVGKLKFSVLHTPGHSPGSVCLRLHQDTALGVPETLFSGDTLFRGSVGRTDLWGGDQDQMFQSIRKRLLVLDTDTRVCPGHGPDTQIGTEKRENRFLQ